MRESGDRGTSTVGPERARNKSALRIALLLSGPIAWVVATLVGRHAPQVAEAVYGGGAGALGGFLLARATGWIPFSVAEFALGAFVAFELGRLVRGVVRARVRDRRWRRLGGVGLDVVRDVSVVVAIFYLVWGFHYARPRLPDRADWPALAADVERQVALAGAQIERANRSYRALHGSDDTGTPTRISPPALEALDRALEDAWAALPDDLALPDAARWRRGPVKEPLIAPIMHRLGLSGFYFPFTGEANVNAGVPIVQRARVMSHEKAHQRGVGPEDEANFLGWMAAARADDDHANYAAAVFASRQLLFTVSPAARDSLVATRLPGVQRDVEDLYAYWRRASGPARDMSRRVNHAYLRGNRVAGGVESYGRSVRLLLAWAQLHGDLDVADPVGRDRTTGSR